MIRIKKVCVLGSGTMGSGIACHFANAGFEVLLLDLPGKGEKRNETVDNFLRNTIKSKPAPLYKKSYASRITTGNFEDDLDKISDCDWILEAVIENLKIKQNLFEKVEKFRRQGSLVTSNTSGIPIEMLVEGRSEDFAAHFCGTHFFNPPRYLPLLEIIPNSRTKSSVVTDLVHLADYILGKTPVVAKDKPAFIANRIGVYAMTIMILLTEKYGIDIRTADKLAGPGLARPKTGLFRLSDLVGLDVVDIVIRGLKDNCPDDKEIQSLTLPKSVRFLLENGYYGLKAGQGFYLKSKEKDSKGKSIIQALNLETLEYTSEKPSSNPASLGISKQIEDPARRIKALYNADDEGGRLVKESLLALFSYTSKRIPEISDSLYQVDNALKSGFGWKFGVFEYWDLIGMDVVLKDAEEEGYEIADWVTNWAESTGHSTFYTIEGGKKKCLDPATGKHASIEGSEGIIILDDIRSKSPVYQNDEVVLHDLGDGVLNLEFRSKSNAIGEGILTGMLKSIEIAEDEDWTGLVIGNNADNFTVGANLMLIAMMAFQQQFDQLNHAIALFQKATMRCRYSKIPVVAATQGYVFGGGCEMSMHCDAVVAAAESYIGLVEMGAGVIPGGGGTKEFALRTGNSFYEGDVKIPRLIESFRTLATAKVATSADEAFDCNYLLHSKDKAIRRTARNIGMAKEEVIRLSRDYVPPIEEKVHVLGRTGLGALYVAANELKMGGWATDYDIHIARKLAWVLCGGDLTGEQLVSQQYLLDLEREAFLSLCGEQKTMERIQHILEHNKPLRN